MMNQDFERDSDLGVWTAGSQAAAEAARDEDELLMSRLEALIGRDSAHEAMESGVVFQFASRMTRSNLEDAPTRNQLALELLDALRNQSRHCRYALLLLSRLINARDSYQESASSVSISVPEAQVEPWQVTSREELVCG